MDRRAVKRKDFDNIADVLRSTKPRPSAGVYTQRVWSRTVVGLRYLFDYEGSFDAARFIHRVHNGDQS